MTSADKPKTNADKYLKDGVSPKAMWYEFKNWYNDTQCTCAYGEAIEIFMKEQAKPTLTEDEKVILRNIKPQPVAITRDSDGDLEIKYISRGMRYDVITEFNHLFQFIQPRRRI